jgi:hypothetical protein
VELVLLTGKHASQPLFLSDPEMASHETVRWR